ncbi:MAG: single-stranded DNA-binding protein [Planctomycetota bacterium]
MPSSAKRSQRSTRRTTTTNVDDATLSRPLISAARALSESVEQLRFEAPVTHVYNPLRYAWSMHRQYLEFAKPTVQHLLLGMNPGPWGMVQSGIPFGEVALVREWLGIVDGYDCEVPQHAKRPLSGLMCSRSEVSGVRLWTLMKERFGTPEAFFKEHMIFNYCPLAFLEDSGRNRTPDKLPAAEREALQAVCDKHLQRVIRSHPWRTLIGVGVYAENCLRRAAVECGYHGSVHRILHPSPASPAANRGWAKAASQQLVRAGVWK